MGFEGSAPQILLTLGIEEAQDPALEDRLVPEGVHHGRAEGRALTPVARRCGSVKPPRGQAFRKWRAVISLPKKQIVSGVVLVFVQAAKFLENLLHSFRKSSIMKLM